MSITGISSGTGIDVPYWYAAGDGSPAHITVIRTTTGARRGSLQRNAILFRITDVSGVVLAGAQPDVSVISGGGALRRITSYDSFVPGLFGIDVRPGLTPGVNVFRIQAGIVKVDVSITGS